MITVVAHGSWSKRSYKSNYNALFLVHASEWDLSIIKLIKWNVLIKLQKSIKKNVFILFRFILEFFIVLFYM